MNFVAWASGLFTMIGTVFGQLAMIEPAEFGWGPLLIQGGMMGVVILLVLKAFPMILNSMKEEREHYLSALDEQRRAHDENVRNQSLVYEETIKRIVAEHEKRTEAHERQMEGWREILTARGFCPVRDGAKAEESS